MSSIDLKIRFYLLFKKGGVVDLCQQSLTSHSFSHTWQGCSCNINCCLGDRETMPGSGFGRNREGKKFYNIKRNI
jgi:hypothetical protein